MDGTETLTMVTVKNIVTPPTSPKKVVSLLHSDISLSTSSLACDISPPPPPPPPPPLPGWGPPPPPPPPPLPGWGPPPPPPPPPLPGWGPPPAPPLPGGIPPPPPPPPFLGGIPPPPPPPPFLGGIPPPPPPFPGGGPVPYAFSRASEHRRSKLKNFNWEAIPEERVRGKKNVWTVASFQHEIDMSRMEELFGRKEEQQLKRRSSSRKSFHAKGPINTEQASLLDDKKSMNVGIFLKQFKKPVHTIVDDIRKGDVTSYGAEKLAELCKLLPERDEEVKIFKSYKGDRTRLSEPDQFMVLLLDIPSCMQRLQMLILKEEFSPQLVALKTSIHVMRSACEELLTCIELHTIIRLVLKAGNYMNSGSYAGNAAGFRMASLLRLADTKANKPGMTLMHFVAMEAEKTDSNLCEFHNKLVHTVSASRIVKQEVEAEFQKVSKKVVAMKTTLNDEADLTQQMEPFLQEAELQIQEVQISMEKLARSVHTLIEFFCEDEEVFKLEECCSVFRTFCEKFSKALKENREWEKAELKKQEQERKRRSIATCSHKEKDMENVELEFLLLQNYKDGWRNRSLRKTPSTSPVLQSKGQQRHTGRTANSQPVTRRGMLSGQQNTEQGQVRVVEKNQDNLNRGTALGQQIRDDGQMQEKRGLQMAENQTTGTQSSKLRERFAMFEKSNTCSKMGRRHTLPVIPFTRSESSEEDSSSKKRPMLSHAGRFFSMDGSPDALSSNADQESPLQQTPRRKSPTVAECMMANGGKTSASNTTPALEPKMTLPEKASSNPDGLNIQEASLHDTSPRQRFTNFLQKMASPRAPDNLSRITDGSETKGSPKPALENSPFVNFFKRQKKLWQKEPYPPQHGQKNELDNEGLTTKVGEEGS